MEDDYNDSDVELDVKAEVHRMAMEAAQHSPPRRVREEDIYRRPEQSSYQERGTEAQVAALYGALAVARGQFLPFQKTKRVEVKKEGRLLYPFEYAPMDVLLAATVPALSANGLMILMPFVTAVNDTTRQLVIIAHSGGGRLCFEFEFCPSNDEKTFGGQTTYLQRYCYRSVLTLAADGDLDEQPTRKDEDSVTVADIKRPSGSERIQIRNGKTEVAPTPAPTAQELNLSEMLSLAKKVGLTKRSQVAEFVWLTLSNGQAFPLGEPFCSNLNAAQLDKCFQALTSRLPKAAGGAR